MNANASIYSITHREIIVSREHRVILGLGTLTLLMALGAMARIPLPFTPVPFTMQVFFLFYGAMALGRRSAISQGAYLGIGALGLPVFAGFAGGISALTGITAGYLFGFILCAFIVGATIGRNEKVSLLRDAAAITLGMLSYYIPGVLWLKFITGMSFSAAFFAGFLPFILVDIAKVTLAYLLYRASRRRLNQLF